MKTKRILTLALFAIGSSIFLFGDDRPVTSHEAKTFGADLQQALGSGDGGAVNALFDYDALIEKAMEGIAIPEPARANLVGRMRQAFQSGELLKVVRKTISDGGSFKFLRVRVVEGESRSLFRLIHGNGKVTYLEMLLERGKDAKPKVVDFLNLNLSELTSTVLRRGILAGAPRDNEALLNKLLSEEALYVKHLDEIESFTELTAKGDTAAATKVYEGLPESLRNGKNLLLMQLQNALRMDGMDYLKVVGTFRALYPDDPALAFTLVDWYLALGSFDKSMEAIDEMEKAVGGDPYLYVLRSGVILAAGNTAEAKGLVRKALVEEPTLMEAYYTLLSIVLEARDFDATVNVLDELEDKFGLAFSDFTKVPQYAEFVKSPQYKTWMEGRSKKEE